MTLRRLLVTGATVAASVIAVLTAVYLVLVAKMGPTPEELAERFSVYAENQTANQNVEIAKRILARDANGDTYISRQELPERMQGLMRGDHNGDGVLTTNEVRTLVNQASSSRARFPAPRPRSQPTGLGDIVRDLRLPPPKHDFAMALLKNSAAESDLFARLHKVLDDEEYENLVAAVTRAGISRSVQVSAGSRSSRSSN